MKNIDRDEVIHIADLSRIKLNDSEKERYSQDLTSILEFVDQLNEIETDKIEPIMNITGLENVMDEDRAKQDPAAEKIIQNAPDAKDGYFRVKKVIE